MSRRQVLFQCLFLTTMTAKQISQHQLQRYLASWSAKSYHMKEDPDANYKFRGVGMINERTSIMPAFTRRAENPRTTSRHAENQPIKTRHVGDRNSRPCGSHHGSLCGDRTERLSAQWSRRQWGAHTASGPHVRSCRMGWGRDPLIFHAEVMRCGD